MLDKPSDECFEQEIQIYREDIDLFEHVNNVVYLKWVQEVSTAHWYSAATESQIKSIGWIVIRHEIDYLNSAKFGDEIIAKTWVGEAKKNIFERYVELYRCKDKKVIAKALSLWCPIDLKTLRPTRVNAEIYERFSVQNNEK